MKYEDARKQEMYEWFRTNFIPTYQCRPDESGKSGYQYVCGGPYFPSDILPKEFGEKYDMSLITEVVSDLESEESEWAKA